MGQEQVWKAVVVQIGDAVLHIRTRFQEAQGGRGVSVFGVPPEDGGGEQAPAAAVVAHQKDIHVSISVQVGDTGSDDPNSAEEATMVLREALGTAPVDIGRSVTAPIVATVSEEQVGQAVPVEVSNLYGAGGQSRQTSPVLW